MRANDGTVKAMWHVYCRVIWLLAPEKTLALLIATASFALACIFLVESYLFGRVVDALVAHRQHQAIACIVLWAGIGLGGIVINTWVSLHADRLAHRRRLAVIAQFFEHTIALPMSFHATHHTGGLLRSMHTGANTLFNLWLGILRYHLTTFMSILVMLPLALILNWELALLLTALTSTFAVSNVVVMRRTAYAQQEVEKLHREIAERTGDVLGNAGVVQSFTRQDDEAQYVRVLSERTLRAQYPVLRGRAWVAIANRSASTLTIVSIFALGTMLKSKAEVSVGQIVMFAGLAMTIVGRLDELSSFAAGLFVHAPALRDFFAVLDIPSHRDALPAVTLPPVRGEVVFENVSFTYDSVSPALKRLSFHAPPGATVAIVGATGAGKTTALSLLYRAYDPSEGRITIDGVDIRTVTLESLRRSVAVVFQDAGLLFRSVADNLRVGNPDATPDEIERSARAAQAHEFITVKPEGYATLVLERGRSLSGGERQRVAIARALLKDAPILILDEATSALDTATEILVQQALRRLMQGRTTFVIAHRLATVRGADWIIVLDRGQVVEQGRYEDLLRLGGTFARLAWLLRRGSDEQEPVLSGSLNIAGVAGTSGSGAVGIRPAQWEIEELEKPPPSQSPSTGARDAAARFGSVRFERRSVTAGSTASNEVHHPKPR